MQYNAMNFSITDDVFIIYHVNEKKLNIFSSGNSTINLLKLKF